ncbi:CcdB family protein [Pseudomonas sp. TUM22785]|uniref:CcdB family protein n=1 Tax=Pseudomonas sp. TUM22785 TaxID=3019098 RepID=UPI002304DE81|nr:CcdB family protein [Pseudomonas sp. TUM22785]WCD81135.1 CcdB family protein [Pseudomonas sp. TUM22785]
MPQFAVHLNTNPATRAKIPYLLDVQSDLIDGLATRLIVPLYIDDILDGRAVGTLMPKFEVEGTTVVMFTPELAGVPRNVLGAQVADLSGHRFEIIAALDLLITGI